ncbi:MAG TPA: CvpA family protein [Rectinemataceae bacterium]|nr:CvpA family protein [Rectinemataceae bacterium]
MNTLDWIFLALLLLAGFRGLMQGIVKELSSVAAPVAGVAAAVFLYKWGAEVLRTQFKLQFAPEVVACLILFIAAFIIVKIIATIVREGLEAAHLDKLDKGLGFVAGLVEGLVVVALVLIVLQVQPVFDVKRLLADSIFAKTLLPIVGPEVAKAFSSLAAPAGKLPANLVPSISAPKP